MVYFIIWRFSVLVSKEKSSPEMKRFLPFGGEKGVGAVSAEQRAGGQTATLWEPAGHSQRVMSSFIRSASRRAASA